MDTQEKSDQHQSKETGEETVKNCELKKEEEEMPKFEGKAEIEDPKDKTEQIYAYFGKGDIQKGKDIYWKILEESRRDLVKVMTQLRKEPNNQKDEQ